MTYTLKLWTRRAVPALAALLVAGFAGVAPAHDDDYDDYRAPPTRYYHDWHGGRHVGPHRGCHWGADYGYHCGPHVGVHRGVHHNWYAQPRYRYYRSWYPYRYRYRDYDWRY